MPFFSPDDIYASAVNRASTLSVTSETNVTRAEFKAYDLEFSDSFQSNWNSTPVFGRMDPIHIFKNTTRSMSFNFNLLSANFNEALWNIEKISLLVLSMYPIYKAVQWDANIFEAAPLVRVKYSIVDGDLTGDKGFLGGETRRPPHVTATDYRGPQRGKDYTGVNIIESDGLPGFITSLNINPVSAMGYHHIKRGTESNVVKIGTEFSPGGSAGEAQEDVFLEKIITAKGDDVIIPKAIKVSFEFTPVHGTALGLKKGASGRPTPRTTAFPYIADIGFAMDHIPVEGQADREVRYHEAMGYHKQVERQLPALNPSAPEAGPSAAASVGSDT